MSNDRIAEQLDPVGLRKATETLYYLSDGDMTHGQALWLAERIVAAYLLASSTDLARVDERRTA
jgi:hypothetical protein